MSGALSGFVLVAPSSAVPELLSQGVLVGGVVVWSLWSGYLVEPSGVRLIAALQHAGVALVEHHTSGHASLLDLKRLVAALNPARLVPIHTAGADQFAQHFPAVTQQDDAGWWAA